ncbi:MAG: hypothetical protein ACREYC_28600, partial [Gammaproteobacteria bacterium]
AQDRHSLLAVLVKVTKALCRCWLGRTAGVVERRPCEMPKVICDCGPRRQAIQLAPVGAGPGH